ncbi:hypothetical protein GE061_005260 [Apolygus lucorum]|uniref:Uncharacterized protein n=1 Tax=Apolygus lucorum TaxID=248454 RepID=A0A6A4IY87_APOLU|nr:hypothetical protein GE061_005260 [Apolygus lucorum]
MGGSIHRTTAERTTAIPFFRPDEITREDTDPEPAEPFFRPRLWHHARPAGLQQGLLYAGKVEFNWIVSVELVNGDPEFWAIGNLVTYRHVLTSCQALTRLEKRKLGDDPVFTIVIAVKISYGAPYLNGDYNPIPDDEGHRVPYDDLPPVIPDYEGAAGVRDGRSIVLHQNCRPLHLLYDFALIELSEGIRPLTPLVGYMPVLEIEPPKIGEKYGPNMTSIKQHRTPCYIASYGKPYYNFKGAQNNIVENFKIKFRVYYVEHRTCVSWLQEVFESGHFDGEYSALLFQDEFQDKLWCFWPRKKVGAICDHDRGAPLVCNGVVYGIVVRGVKFNRCDTMNPFPVIVSEVYEYVEELYYQFERGVFRELSLCSRIHLPVYLLLGSVLLRLVAIF